MQLVGIWDDAAAAVPVASETCGPDRSGTWVDRYQTRARRGRGSGFAGGLRKSPEPDITPERAANWVDGPYPVPNPLSFFGLLTSGLVSDPNRNIQGSSPN
jgi:hypothetical protein